ncbi:ABC transporter ATP-binding protein [Rubeoparvulum massiliense]|uniref:ABC transporter ATP-binding protein n=1 Tax=Rubeoparvulum massiliense TaxID=1631346 RepID=UPI00065DEAF8|nr:oligopeptide/dipeptide ABC transporter ATP-binding protein [Rubeoparvulum massiliense]
MAHKRESKSEYLLEVVGLTKHFPLKQGWLKRGPRSGSALRAVDDVSLTLKEGETLGIVGESGCGKSTTANLIMRLLEPTEGKIYFDGVDWTALPARDLREKRKEMQMIFQDPYSSLNPRMRVKDLIAEPLRTHTQLSRNQIAAQVEELLEVVGLDPSYGNRYPHEFSGGQRQRIGIARALALRPRLIICDEPVSALDVSIQAQILNLLVKLKKEYQLTYLFIAHGLPVVKHISDRIAVMYLGQVVELASKVDLFAQPRHPYTEGLLAAVPIPDPSLRGKEVQLLEGDLPSPANPPSGCRFHPRCPYATQVCQEEIPPLQELTINHWVACHHPLQQGKGALR